MNESDDIINIDNLNYIDSGKGINYIKNNITLSNKYSKIYYKRAKYWKITFLLLHIFAGILTLAAAILVLNDFKNVEVNRLLSGIFGLIATALISINTKLDPSLRQKKNEHAGDLYLNIYNMLSLINLNNLNNDQINSLTKWIFKKNEKMILDIDHIDNRYN